MAKVLCKLVYPRELPLQGITGPVDATAFVNEPALKRRRLITQAKRKLSRASEMTPDVHVKRRKMTSKQSVQTALQAWTQIFDQVDSELPRVGKKKFENSGLLADIQELLPDKVIRFAIACMQRVR